MKVFDHIRYRFWQLNCSRMEWCQRVVTAWEAGYGRNSEDSDRVMFRYWQENVKS